MAVMFGLLVALFAAKLAWNVSLPLRLARARRITPQLRVEIGLLVAMMLVAARPELVAIVGCGAIAASYAAAFGLGTLCGWRYRSPR